MWLICEQGTFTIVQKLSASRLTVRAHVASDLERLRSTYLPELGPTELEDDEEFAFSAVCTHEQLGDAMRSIAEEIDYGSLRRRLAQQGDGARAAVYDQAARAMSGLEDLIPRVTQASGASDFPTLDSRAEVGFGGVLVDRELGQLLLRKPTGHFGGYAWTIAKGRPLPGEEPHETAVREVYEETGYRARIIEPIPQWFEGDHSVVGLYVMEPLGEPEPFEAYTQSVRWVDPHEAYELVSENRTPRGRRRDRRVVHTIENWLAQDLQTRLSEATALRSVP